MTADGQLAYAIRIRLERMASRSAKRKQMRTAARSHQGGFLITFVRGIFAGWLIALMV